MRTHRNWLYVVVLIGALALMPSCIRRKKYENPIGKDTQQPDKVLFDKAIKDIEKGRYEVARLTLNTLINTYDTSEFLAKAKLAMADSYFREGGSHGLAQAEAEYKDFILFYPTMEEAAEAQEKVCKIHVNQMEKADRDPMHAQRAEEECRQLLTQFPNSKFAVEGQQLLRNIQEVLAQSEYHSGHFYYRKGTFYAAANRLQTLTDHFPLFSASDQALFELGDSYSRLGPRFRDKSGAAFAKLVKDYPLSPLVEDATARLKQMEMAVPPPDPVAMARMKYEQENRTKVGLMGHFWGVFRKGPDMTAAAKSGQPQMESLRPGVPVSVPVPAAPAAGGTTDVTATTVGANSALDTQPDARQNPNAGAAPAEPAASQTQTDSSQSGQNNASQATDNKKSKKNKKNKTQK